MRLFILQKVSIMALSSSYLIYLAFAAVAAGIAGLVWSADRFVAGSAAIARSFGIAPMIIGLTIVSFGTSAPEVMVSISSALKDAGDLAVGNAIGSNIANMALVLGVTALLISIPVQHHLLRTELPVLFIITATAGLFLADNVLQLWEGLILFGTLLPAMVFLIKRKPAEMTADEIQEEQNVVPELSRSAGLMWFVIGLLALIVSSEVLVWGAKSAALHFGVSPLLIGLTVVALGTSLPELAASVTSALKGHHDIALGNVIGSNMFNLQVVMALPVIISPPLAAEGVFYRDYMTMLVLTILLTLAVVISLARKGATAGLGKPIGVILLAIYLAYYVVIFLS